MVFIRKRNCLGYWALSASKRVMTYTVVSLNASYKALMLTESSCYILYVEKVSSSIHTFRLLSNRSVLTLRMLTLIYSSYN